MRIGIFGAGAVGGYLAARLLEAARHDISIVARGAQRDAIARHGLTLESGADTFTARPRAVSDRAEDLGPQDLVFVTAKAHSLPEAARDIAAMLGPGAAVVFVCNGIPWWWNHGNGPGHANPLPLLDPDAALWDHVTPERAIGCVVYSANEVVRPGVVRHAANNRWLLGEPDRSRSPRLSAVTAVLREAGLAAEVADDLRSEIWAKLLRNAPLNSICALTRLTIGDLRDAPQLTALAGTVVDEIAAIASAHGADVSAAIGPAKAAALLGGAVDGARPAGIRPSMLQDVLRGRRMETDSILGQVQLLARQAGVATPTIDLLLPLLRGLDRGSG